jgi:hypothetical protein
VQRIKNKVGNRWGLSRKPIDLMNKPNVTVKNIIWGANYNVVIKLV